MNVVVELDGVTLSYGAAAEAIRILDAVTLAVSEGETLAIVGPSGSGKTSLVRIVLGLLAPTRGSVRLRGRDVSRDGHVVVPPEARGLAVVFQDLALWPHLSVYDNLAFGLDSQQQQQQQQRKSKNEKPGKLDRSERDRRIRDALARVGLGGDQSFEAVSARSPTTLSGGERQRVAIARAIVMEPDVLLFDEPLTSLDVELKEEMLTLLAGILRERSKAATIFITHDAHEVARLDRAIRGEAEVAPHKMRNREAAGPRRARVAVLERGAITQEGSLDELRQNPSTPFVRAFVRSLGASE